MSDNIIYNWLSKTLTHIDLIIIINYIKDSIAGKELIPLVITGASASGKSTIIKIIEYSTKKFNTIYHCNIDEIPIPKPYLIVQTKTGTFPNPDRQYFENHFMIHIPDFVRSIGCVWDEWLEEKTSNLTVLYQDGYPVSPSVKWYLLNKYEKEEIVVFSNAHGISVRLPRLLQNEHSGKPELELK